MVETGATSAVRTCRVSGRLGDQTEDGFSTTILSDVDNEQLFAEVSVSHRFPYLLDRELGREDVRIAFPLPDGELGTKKPLADFIAHLQAEADSLRRRQT